MQVCVIAFVFVFGEDSLKVCYFVVKFLLSFFIRCDYFQLRNVAPTFHWPGRINLLTLWKEAARTFNWAEGSKSWTLCNVKRFPLQILSLLLFFWGNQSLSFLQESLALDSAQQVDPLLHMQGGITSILEEWFREALKKIVFLGIFL